MDKRKRRLLCMLEGSGRKSRWISGAPPLSFKAQAAGTIENYRIYGSTVGGESVGDRTGNLFEAELVNYNVNANGKIDALTDFILSIAPVIAGTTYTISNNQVANAYAFYQQYPKPESYSYNSSRYVFNENSITIVAPIDGYIVVRKTASDPPIMLNVGSAPLPYEPYGYKVPVTVEGKNLINSSIYEIRNTGVEYTVNNDKSVTANGSTSSIFSLFLVKVYLTKGSYIISGCPQNGSQNTYRCEIRDMELTSLSQDAGAGVTYSIVTDGYYYYSIRIAQNYVCDNLTFYPMIRKADIEDDTYEPYHDPVTAPIYLPQPIKMVGDEAEYIDYAEQKMHRIGADDLNVTLPALPTLAGTNVLSVGTAVQPSNIEIKGKIKAI